MTAIPGAVAAVTGAASGIGRALALELAARGCDLALADRDEAGLQSVAAEIAKNPSQKVSVHRVDVAEPKQIEDFAQGAVAAHPGLNILVNNAGVALLGQFNEVDQAEIDWLMNINFWGVVHATRAFLRIFRVNVRPISSTSRVSLVLSRRRGRPPTLRRNSRCAAFPRACATNCRWRQARCACRWCIPAASPPTSSATPAWGSASPTMRGAPKRSSGSIRSQKPRPPPPRSASSPASKKTRRAS